MYTELRVLQSTSTYWYTEHTATHCMKEAPPHTWVEELPMAMYKGLSGVLRCPAPYEVKRHVPSGHFGPMSQRNIVQQVSPEKRRAQ